MSFLPQDYTAPKSSSSYLKILEGENRIRILSKPIMGWEDWEDNKPIRFEFNNKPAKSIDPKKPIRHFWAFIVFNYVEEKIQIMQISQNTIRKSIESLCRDADWGDPYNYDIKITRTGKGVDTEYTVNPVPHKPVDPYIIKCFHETPIYLEALFLNQDPFAREWDTHTPLAIEASDKIMELPKTNIAIEKITQEEADRLHELILECDPKIQDNIWEHIKPKCQNSKDLSLLDPVNYKKIMRSVVNRRNEYQATLVESQEVPF